MSKVPKSVYNSSLLMLTKSFCNDEIDIKEYKSALFELCKCYRNDYHKNRKEYVYVDA